MALAIISLSHAEVMITSHCDVIDDRAVFRAKLVIIYVDCIALLRRLLIRDNDRAVYRATLITIYVDWIALLRRLLMSNQNRLIIT